MARKKIKFALKMKDGAEARTLQELKEAFDLNQIVAYFLDGKLETWLLDRYYEELAEKISNLDKSDPKLKRRLCEIFGVEYEEDSLSIEEIEERNQRIQRLKENTDDENIIKNVDKVAFSQEELADLLDEGETTIYLCGTDFYIPISKKGITYIGIKTKLDITQEERGQYQANDIELIGLLDGEESKETEKYQSDETISNYYDDIHAIVLCEDKENKENFLAYITRKAQPYKDEKFNGTNLPEVQYQAYLKKIESSSLNIRTCKDAYYKGNKIIYEAEDGQGIFWGIMDSNGDNNKIIKRVSTDNFSIECIGKNYILADLENKTGGFVGYVVHRIRKGIITRISIEGMVDKIEIPNYFSHFYEMPQGFFRIDNDHSNEGIVLYELLNEETQIRTCNISIKDYKVEDIDSTFDCSGKVHSVYSNTDMNRIYFFWEPKHRQNSYWRDGKGYFYYLDINTKEANRAVYQSIFLEKDFTDFVVKDTKIIYFEKNKENFCLTALDMNSGKKEYLWEGINDLRNRYPEKAINLIGEYLYFIAGDSEKKETIYRIKVDGSEKTIIKVDKSINLTNLSKICTSDRKV